MIRKEAAPYWVHVYIAGDAVDARRLCRQFCMRGLCVTVTPTEFVYTGGAESGVCIGLVNYPRFPKESAALWETAEQLALFLIGGLCQWSALLQAPDRCLWLTDRPEEQA